MKQDKYKANDEGDIVFIVHILQGFFQQNISKHTSLF